MLRTSFKALTRARAANFQKAKSLICPISFSISTTSGHSNSFSTVINNQLKNSSITSGLFSYYSNAKYIHTTGSANYSAYESELDKSLHRIDVEIRRTGRINRREIEEILEDVREMKSLTSNQSLMIIRCCGELVPEETFENRTKLVQEVWKTMESLKVPLDISHYNALLRVYIENEHKFNPSEFLEELSNRGLEPNRVTYQRLILRFCQEGDIEGSSTILQHMKEKELPINTHVFNALILGHATANDMESAEGIISVMKQAGLEPNDDTYATLMCGYAKKGDIENINRIIKDCEAKEVYLVDRDFLEVIYALSSSNHEQLATQIIPLLKRHAGYNQEATNVILRLINIGKVETAYLILKTMSRAMKADQLAPSGNFFIRQLVASDVPSETVLKYCHEMVNEGANKYALVRASEFSLQLKQFDKAFDFLEALHESGFPLRQHYFWPFFAMSQCEKDVYDGLKCMSYLDIFPTVETLRDYVIPGLLKNSKEQIGNLLDKLSQYTKIPNSTIVPAALQYIFQTQKLDLAAQFAMKYRVNFNNVQIRKSLIDSYLRSNDVKSFVTIIASAGIDGDDSGREAVGMVLMELLRSLRDGKKLPVLLPVLKECYANGLGLSTSSQELIQNNLGDDLSPEVSSLLLSLSSPSLVPNPSIFSQFATKGSTGPELDEKSVEELEEILKKDESGKPNKGLKKVLLTHYVRAKDVEKAEKMFEDLKSVNFVFSPGMYSLFLDMYCTENNLEKAREMYKAIEDREFFNLDDIKILKYAHLLVTHNQPDEAVEFLKKQGRNEERVPRGLAQNALVWKILNHFGQEGNVEKVNEFLKVLKERGLTSINSVILGPLINAHLVKGDIEGALSEFERCVNEHSLTPLKNLLFSHFIKSDDAERLQKVLDLSTKVHGEVNSLYDLVFAFIDCGKIRQAKKILETPGLRARQEKLDYICQGYLNENKIEELESLVSISKDVYNIDRNSLYFYLLKAYCKLGDTGKALSIWTSLQEENVQPSDELLIYLASFLQKNGTQVPFVIPELKKSSISQELLESKAEKTVSNAETNNKSTRNLKISGEKVKKYENQSEMMRLLDDNKLDEALEYKNNFEKDGKYLSLIEKSRLVSKLVNGGRVGEATKITINILENGTHPLPQTLKVLVSKLGAAGEVETLIKFDQLLSDSLKKFSALGTRLCLAYNNSGRGVEFFEERIKGVATSILNGETKNETNLNSIPVSGAIITLRSNEQLLSSYEELAKKLGEVKENSLYKALYSYYMLKKEFDKAKEILENNLKDEKMLYYKTVMFEAVRENDEKMIESLNSQLFNITQMAPADRGNLKSAHIDVLCKNEKVEEAFNMLVQNIKSEKFELNDINLKTLMTLKRKMEEKKLKFPYDEHLQSRKIRGRKQESSSSSDSDSD